MPLIVALFQVPPASQYWPQKLHYSSSSSVLTEHLHEEVDIADVDEVCTFILKFLVAYVCWNLQDVNARFPLIAGSNNRTQAA